MAKNKKNIKEENITLPTILGMRPGKWLFISSIIVLILAFFLICMLPGIVNGGRLVTFNSELTNVGIKIDDIYIGSTNNTKYFVESGKHIGAYYKDDVLLYEENIEINDPIFFTLFSKRKSTIEVETKYPNELITTLSNSFYDDVYTWSKVIDFDDSYNYPPLAQNFAKDSIALNQIDISQEMYFFLTNTTSLNMKDDLDQAILLLDSSKVNYKSSDFNTLYLKLDSIFNDNNEVLSSNKINQVQVPTKFTENGIQFFNYDGCEVYIGRTTDLSYPELIESPVSTNVNSFAISNLITEAQFAKFIVANPQWSKEFVDFLIMDNLVDEYYLAGITLNETTTSTKPIRNISYNAALAYTEWLSTETGKTIRLPSEAEWQVMAESVNDKAYALSLTVIDFNTSTPTSVMGGLWEMTNTPFVPLSRISNYDAATNLAKSTDYYDIIVKGGSIANSSDDITINSVGVMNRSKTSDFAGFRVVMEN